MPEPPVRDAQAILQSLQAGVVPRAGLHHLAVGRVPEVRQALAELEVLRDGGGVFKVVVGDYGSGKTFLLALIRQVALARGYLVADADLGPDLRLRGDDRGLATYRQLMARVSSEGRPDGGALGTVLDRWAERVRSAAAARLPPSEDPAAPPPGASRSPDLAMAVDRELRSRLRGFQDQPGGFAWAAVLRRYYEAALAGDEAGLASSLRWLRGEFRSAAEARAVLGSGAPPPITDATWYEHLRLLALLAADAGYAGLLVMLDEGVNLLRIGAPESRAANYEVVLRLCNDTLQGRSAFLGFYLAGPPEMVTDVRRGFHSYPALRSRLQANPYADARHRDLTQPVLSLAPLTADELLALLYKVRSLHAAAHGPSRLGEAETATFLGRLLARPGAERFLTVRGTLRAFLQALSVLAQNPEMEPGAVLGQAEEDLADSRFVSLDVDAQGPV